MISEAEMPHAVVRRGTQGAAMPDGVRVRPQKDVEPAGGSAMPRRPENAERAARGASCAVRRVRRGAPIGRPVYGESVPHAPSLAFRYVR